MSIHEYDIDMRPDSEFIPGENSLLVEGNKCRLLDGRRTRGYIENVLHDCGMFRWRITKYEDKGKFWDLPFEDITKFQFEKDSRRLEKDKINEIVKIINKYSRTISVSASQKDKEISEKDVMKSKEEISKWMQRNSLFLKNNEILDFNSCEGSEILYQDLKNYMKYKGLNNEEKMTSENIVLNPNSGEWILGMRIVLAEMGMCAYIGKMPRTKEIFEGIGNKQNIRKYIVNRLGFIRAYFNFLNIKNVVLYRGMCSEKGWYNINRTFLSMTFSKEVAESFSDFDKNSKYRISYLLKMTVPVEKLFMTFLETKEMNKKYKESEALIIYNDKIIL